MRALLLLLLCGAAAGWDICGIRGCFCDASRDSADCGGLFFEKIPQLPPWLRSLRLVDGHVTALAAHSFLGSPLLDSLELRHSDLAFLHPRAFADLAALTRLDLAGNNLAALPPLLLQDSRRLSALSLPFNPIRDLADVLAALPHRAGFRMASLDLAGLGLRLAGHSDVLPPVDSLNLSRNAFLLVNATGVLLPPGPKCREERCRFLRVDWTSLTELDIAATNATLTSHFLTKLAGLRRISIGGNNLLAADALNSLYGFKKAIALNVSGLLIEHKTGQVPSWDIFPPALRTLDISRLGIVHIDTDFAAESNVLTHLYAQDNLVEELALPPQLRQLEHLNLAGNRLYALPKLTGWKEIRGLTHLDLSRNRIDYLANDSLIAFPGLKTLLLAGNTLHGVGVSAFPSLGLSNLRHLDLSHNAIVSLPSLLLPSLRILDLSNNQLRALSNDFFLGLPDLTSLNLSGNSQLLALSTHCNPLDLRPGPECFPPFLAHLGSLVFLATLDLSSTSLVNLPPRLLGSFRLLNILQLNGNLLTGEVWDEWQRGGNLPSCLVLLGLSGNLIQNIKNLSFAQPGGCLEHVDLSLNSFHCDCTLAPLRRLLFPPSGVLIPDARDPERYACATPTPRPLFAFLAAATTCAEEKRRENVLVLSIATGFFLASCLAVALCWRIGSLCGRRVSQNMHYLYRPLATIPSQLSSPVHL